MRHLLTAILALVILAGCNEAKRQIEPASKVPTANEFVDSLDVKYRVITNRADE